MLPHWGVADRRNRSHFFRQNSTKPCQLPNAHTKFGQDIDAGTGTESLTASNQPSKVRKPSLQPERAFPRPASHLESFPSRLPPKPLAPTWDTVANPTSTSRSHSRCQTSRSVRAPGAALRSAAFSSLRPAPSPLSSRSSTTSAYVDNPRARTWQENWES